MTDTNRCDECLGIHEPGANKLCSDGKKTITISLVEYEGLLAESRLLNALENAGVDNWHGYEYAMDELQEAGEFDD